MLVMLLGVYKYIQVLLALMIPCGLVISICMGWIVEIIVNRLSN